MPRRSVVAVALVIALAGCSPDDSGTETPSTDGAGSVPPTSDAGAAEPDAPADLPADLPDLEVALVWHQHQPRYPAVDGVVTRPWVRLHAAKDYVDMATLTTEFPGLAVTFNLTPVLLDQLEALSAGARDTYWVAAETPLAELTPEQRQFVTDRFFDVNPRVVETFPRYVELREIRESGRAYTDAELQDLRALFHLAWIDPEVPERAPFVEQGRDFTDDDVLAILAITQDLVEATIPTHAELWAQGGIEVTTTPLAHPILPLVADTDLALVGDPTAVMPREPFREFGDAREQVRLGLERASSLLGDTPTGMWPGEGAVAQPVMRLFAEHGVEWVASGEDVLAKSLGVGTWTRDEDETVQEAELLYRPWRVETPEGSVAMFFRDNRISDLIGFEYSGSDPVEAVDDLMARLAAIREQLAGVELDFQPVVSIILDGENAWESYPNDGRDFLRELYGRLTTTDWLTTTTPTRWLAEHGDDAGVLDDVFPAAWFTPNYSIWIGEEQEAAAWDLLRRTRLDLRRAEQQGAPAEQLDAAYAAMYAAEGSDWFWWYGADQESGDDGYFDAAYRELLGQVYDALGLARPRPLDVPIVPAETVEPEQQATDPVTVTIDGVADDWSAANRFSFEDGPIDTFALAVDDDHLAVLLSGSPGHTASGGAEVYLGVPRAPTRRGTTIDDRVLGFDATHLIRVGVDGAACLASTLPPVAIVGELLGDCEPIDSAVVAGDGTAGVELAVPVAALGGVGAGDRIVVRVLADGQLVPADGAGAVPVPDIAGFDAVVEVDDPVGDDTGIGTYTYPTDPLFIDGSYDLTGFQAGVSGDDAVFSFTVDAPVRNPWGSPNGLAIQTFDVYLDVDPGAGTGRSELLDGRNARLPEGSGWDVAVTIEGWDSAVAVPLDGGGYEETKPDIRIAVLSEDGRVTVRVPLAALPESLDLATADVAVAVMSQEGFPSSGVRRIRDIGETAEQYRGGGAPPGDDHPRIYDVLWTDDDQGALLADNVVPVI